MYQVDYVEFKKERDLGAIITDTFKFIRLEWKPFFTSILKVSLLPILLAVASMLYYVFSFSNMFTAIQTNKPEVGDFSFLNSAGILLSVFFLSISFILAWISINLSGFYYIKSYVDNRGVVDYAFINQKVREKFWSFLGLGILIGITITIGLFFCGLPGVYFYVVFTLAFPLMVFAQEDAFDAYGNSFAFVRGHWWETFGCILVVAILTNILGYIFSIPAFVYSMFQGFVSIGTDDPTALSSLFTDPVYITLEIISYLGRFMFYAVTLISTIFIYFDINEQKNASGTFEEIDNLGN